MTRTKRHRAICAAGLALVLAGACTYQPSDRDNPVQRGLSWFSYLNGDDLQAACKRQATGPDRYRIVFNAPGQRQVRTYDLTRTAAGADMVVQVSGNRDFTRAIPLDDLLKPWRATTGRASLDAAAFRALREALHAGGFDVPPPEGTRVTSEAFFWIAAACEGGTFTYNGWAEGTPRFRRLDLKPVLARLDPTGIPFAEPSAGDGQGYPSSVDRDERRSEYYDLVITPSGISGQFTPF